MALADGDGADQNVRHFGYDAEGNVTETTDVFGRKTRMIYDAVNRLIETAHPASTPRGTDNARARQSYFKEGQLKTTTDERGYVTSYTYDEAGR